MDVCFGIGGELLTPLEDMLDGDIKLSLELDLELKDPLSGNITSCADDWGGWCSLRTSPISDITGEKENCIMVSPEAVMPYIKREIKYEPSPSPPRPQSPEYDPLADDPPEEYEDEEDEEQDDEAEHQEEEEEEEEEYDEEEEEEQEQQVVREVKILPKERNLWNSAILTKPTVLKPENSGLTSYLGKPKTEIIVPKSPATSIKPQQTVRVLHATKKSTGDASPNPRSLLVKRAKEVEGYPKPAYSYSCLIAMALKNSVTGSLPVSEIYNFMCEHFPYFKSAPMAWKNSVRHNLSLNKSFEKIEKGGAGGSSRKGCLWAMNPDKIAKMEDEVAKWSKKDPSAIRRAMRYPDELERLERGDLKIGFRRESCDSGAEEDESSDSSDSESEEVPPSLKRFDSRLSSQESNDLGLPDEMYEELGLLEEVMSSDAETEPSGPEIKRIRLGLNSYQRQPVRPV